MTIPAIRRGPAAPVTVIAVVIVEAVTVAAVAAVVEIAAAVVVVAIEKTSVKELFSRVLSLVRSGRPVSDRSRRRSLFCRRPSDLPEFAGIPEEHRQLWDRICQFQLDDLHAEKPFSRRLAIMFGWSAELSGEVIDEYRKFMFLCTVCDHMVSPSVTVDEAWHLHLQYTRSYERFCREALGRFIHHNPSTGGRVEKARFRSLYRQTLNQYYRFFGLPPVRIWGPENVDNVYASCAEHRGEKVKFIRGS